MAFTFPIYGHYVRIIRVWKDSQNMAVNMEKASVLTLFYLPDLRFTPEHVQTWWYTLKYNH